MDPMEYPPLDQDPDGWRKIVFPDPSMPPFRLRILGRPLLTIVRVKFDPYGRPGYCET